MFLYRVVRGDPPTTADFRSHEARGRPLPPGANEQTRRLWSGISVYDTEERARQAALDYPRLGAYIAMLEVREEDPVRAERTTASLGHHTLWGEPAVLLGRTLAVKAMVELG